MADRAPRRPRLGHVRWGLLLLALVCLVLVAVGAALLASPGEGGEALGFALVGFFGAGVVVLTRSALSTR